MSFKLVHPKNWQWYLEYQSGIRITFYFSLMINNFPVLVFCKFDNPHDPIYWKRYVLQILLLKWERNVSG